MSTKLWLINWEHICQKEVFLNPQKYGKKKETKGVS